MAEIKFSELAEATSLEATDYLALARAGTSKKISGAAVTGASAGSSGAPFDLAPAIPHAMDDEFTGLSLNAKWHVDRTGGAPDASLYRFNTPPSWFGVDASVNGWVFYRQELAALGQAFEIVAKVSFAHLNFSSIKAIGLGVGGYADPAFGEISFWGLYQAADNSQLTVQGRRGNGLGSDLVWAAPVAIPWTQHFVWLRVKCATSSGVLVVYLSGDGTNWIRCPDGQTSDGSPAGRIGFLIKTAGLAVGAAWLVIDYFRRLAWATRQKK